MGQNKNGFYYDQLKDETSDACISLTVPALIRARLQKNKTIECYAFITKKVQWKAQIRPGGGYFPSQISISILWVETAGRMIVDDDQISGIGFKDGGKDEPWVANHYRNAAIGMIVDA